MSKKILILSNHYLTIFCFRMELLEKLIEEGHQVYISVPANEKNKVFSDLGCKIIETHVSRHGLNPIEDYSVVRKYKEIIKDIKPDMIFSYTIKPNIYGAIASKSTNIPLVANITGLGTAVENGGILQKVVVALYQFSFKKVKTIFFQNVENRQFFIDKHIRISAHKLLPGSGVNLKKFSPISYPSEDTLEFVFISRVMKEKGVDHYLEAAKFIKNKYPNTKFHICGFCEENYQEIIDQAHCQGTIIYHRLVDDIRTVLEKTHCTIHPTYYPEGLSNTLLESCASARPIITTDRSGCREVVNDGVNGFIVKQRNTEDLILQIEKFLSLSYEEKVRMGLNGREKVEKEFDRNIVVNAYLKEIEEISK